MLSEAQKVLRRAAFKRWANRHLKAYRSTPEFKARRNAKRKITYARNPKPLLEACTRHRLKVRDAVLQHYGKVCFCCGEANKGFLTLDHIDGIIRELEIVGKKLSGGPLYSYLYKSGFPEGYRTACYNCNLGIGHWGVCPHKRVPY